MSATANNAGGGWADPSRKAGPLDSDPASEGGRNALQALLAFACIHEQAARRRRLSSALPSEALPSDDSPQEELALDDVLQLVAERAVSVTGADGVAIALAEEDAIVCRAASGRIAPDAGVKLDPHSGFSGACLLSGQTVRCDDSEIDPRVNAQACRALGTRSMIAVPLSAKKRVVGLVEAFSTDACGFNDSDVRSLTLLGELILAAIRPEEEDRLAELSRQILPVSPEVASAADSLKIAPTVTPSRVLIDEKFTPEPVWHAPAVLHPTPTVLEEPLPAVSSSHSMADVPPADEPVQTSEMEPPPAEKRSLSSIALTAASIFVAIALLWGLIWKGKHVEQTSASTRTTVEMKAGDLAPRGVIPPPPVAVKSGQPSQVTGIRHWSSADSSTVVVDLEDQIQYEQNSLDNPARIYFDLHDTKMAAGLMNQIIEVNDVFVKRVRMAQPVDGVTRVVIEPKRLAQFSVSLDSSPYRLTIQVHEPGPFAEVKTPPLPLPKPSPSVQMSATKPSASTPAALGEFQVVLDAGHGGWDLGTVGRKGLLEKDLVLDIVLRLGKLIQSGLGAQVIYTRQDDLYLPLEKRAEIANLARADLFLSVHANYSDLATARGVETYYTNTYSSIRARTSDATPALKQVNWASSVDIRAKVTDSHRLAQNVQQALYGGLAARNPDIRNRGVKEAQYVVLTGTQMPAVLAEVSFVSSPADEDRLQSTEYRQQIAESLYKGVAKYRDGIKHAKLASTQKMEH